MNRRTEIAEEARYIGGATGYYVRWNGKLYTSDETHTLVDKVLEDEWKEREYPHG